MKIKFWGIRGSIPTPLTNEKLSEKLISLLKIIQEKELNDEDSIREYIKKLPFPRVNTYGGNTSCVEVKTEKARFILDAGTGIRNLGLKLMKEEFGKGQGKAYIYISHSHWDHIQGIPFFLPLFVPGNEITFISPIPKFRERLSIQQYDYFFPIMLKDLNANIEIIELNPDKSYIYDGVSLKFKEMHHPGKSFSISLEENGKKLVYCTDAEFNHRSIGYVEERVKFFDNADALIFDAQYDPDESFIKVDYGHSSSAKGIDLAFKSNVKKIIFFHIEPVYDDEHIFDLHIRAINYKNLLKEKYELDVIQPYEGLELDI